MSRFSNIAPRKFILGEHYRERDSGTWREAEEYLKREREKKGGSQ
jgi:hypothetical protein